VLLRFIEGRRAWACNALQERADLREILDGVRENVSLAFGRVLWRLEPVLIHGHARVAGTV
jgi:hypothetical protein